VQNTSVTEIYFPNYFNGLLLVIIVHYQRSCIPQRPGAPLFMNIWGPLDHVDGQRGWPGTVRIGVPEFHKSPVFLRNKIISLVYYLPASNENGRDFRHCLGYTWRCFNGSLGTSRQSLAFLGIITRAARADLTEFKFHQRLS